MYPKNITRFSHLVLTECSRNATEQQFKVDEETGTITLGNESGKGMCVTLSGYETKAGRPLLLDHCRHGFYLQRIVGMCLNGDSPKPGTWAFAKSCGKHVEMPSAGASLFCFMGVLPDSGEVGLMEAAQSRGGSIFACENSKVYWTEIAGTYDTPDGSFSANAGVFVKLWQEVFDDEIYKFHDWTVKVDPDTVWVPSRLRERLWGMGVHIDDVLYVKNTWKFNGFLGPIEIMNQLAVIRLSEAAVAQCTYSDSSGEDGWLNDCMENFLGIGFRQDGNILNSDSNLDVCGDSSYVAFHYYKDPGSWNECLNRAER